jgi:hypothetical protein
MALRKFIIERDIPGADRWSANSCAAPLPNPTPR